MAGISIHAPAKGATPDQVFTAAYEGHFNPRSREGSDSRRQPTDGIDNISIHAPAKGATRSRLSYTANSLFQSTLPRRERRPADRSCSSRLRYFNPRSREGSDPRKYMHMILRGFQSTLP